MINLQNDDKTGPNDLANAPNERRIPRTVPFSLSEQLFEVIAVSDGITVADGIAYKNREK